ncbi:cytochrome p450 protein [Apiospora sp. TS-2023a]
MNSDGQVYLGAWTNWSKGHVMGATLTMTREQGNFLIAFTAFFIPFVVSRLWRAFAMLFHQYYSTSEPRDAIHHQRQVLLRSSSSPESSLKPFAHLIWKWQGTGKRPWLRVFPAAILSFLCICIATVAGGYSSKISTAGEVLLKGDTCEIPSPPGGGSIAQQAVSRSVNANRMNDIANYAQQCYSNQTSGLLECSSPADDNLANYTYAVPDVATHAMQYFMFRGSLVKDDSAFIPHPELLRPDGDVTLIFLSGNGLRFIPQADDEWYRATVHNGYVYRSNSTNRLESYRSEEAASPLGCIEQYQWCRDPLRGQCGDLASSEDALYSAAPWFNLTGKDLDPDRPVATTKMGSLFIWAYFSIFPIGTYLEGLISTLGPRSLSSNNVVQQGTVGQLESNQWQIDVARWWSIVLAGFQASFVSTARGRSDSSPRLEDTMKPANEYEWDICRNQKIRSAQHSSFSIFGLVFTYSIGALIVVISFTISPILHVLQKRGLYNKYAYLEWEGHTAIQLHRVAQDQSGYGRWSRCDELIPITRPGEMLAPFDISDPEHPMLAASRNNPAPEATAPEEKSSQLDQTPQESPLEPSDEKGFSRSTSLAVRQAAADSNSQSPTSDCSPVVEEDLEGNQQRPSTAP